MVGLGALLDDGVLDLDEVADVRVLGDLGAGAQAGEGADASAPRLTWQPSRWQKAWMVAPDLDRDLGAEDDVRADRHVAADHRVEREPDGGGVGQGGAVRHRLGAGAGLEGGLGGGEVGAGVDAERLGLGAGDGARRVEAAGAGERRRRRSGSIRPWRCRGATSASSAQQRRDVGGEQRRSCRG